MAILLMAFSGYSISDYRWILYYKLFVGYSQIS